jgi:AcrR family transcriptional regulator
MTDKPAKKSERTQALIMQAALELFGEQGYDATTMRQIAQRAGVSVGNSYYYFESKEQLIQAFYAEFALLTTSSVGPSVASIGPLDQRIVAAMNAWFELATPYHRFFEVFLRNAADFSSPNSPFSEASAIVRQKSYDAWKLVLSEATDAPSPEQLGPIYDRLPQILWLYALSIIAVWSQDPTPDGIRAKAILGRTVGPVTQAVRLAANPIATPFALQLLGLLDELTSLRETTEGDLGSTA